jgi:nicotinamidase-related amidase
MFVVVDYVNEMCDMRLKSQHPDGVPDHIVESIAASVANLAAAMKTNPTSP